MIHLAILYEIEICSFNSLVALVYSPYRAICLSTVRGDPSQSMQLNTWGFFVSWARP